MGIKGNREMNKNKGGILHGPRITTYHELKRRINPTFCIPELNMENKGISGSILWGLGQGGDKARLWTG